jgi:hypothetical protein
MTNASIVLAGAIAALLPVAPLAADVAFIDSQGREWRKLDGTIGRTWLAVAGACPTDGVTPCTGALGSLVVDGYVWATRQQVQDMLAEFSAAVVIQPCVSGADVSTAADSILFHFGGFPVFDSIVMASGLTATAGSGALPSTYAYAPSVQTDSEFIGGSLICTTTAVPKTSADSSQGIWLFRPPQCRADLDGDGVVSGSDLGMLLAAWGPCAGTPCGRDLDADGAVGGGDLGVLLAAWGACR